jgi:O-antigen ligase
VAKRAAQRHRAPAPTSPLDRLAFAAGVVLVLVAPLVWDTGSASPFRGFQGTIALTAWAVLAVVFLVRSPEAAVWGDPWWLPWAGVMAGAALSAVPSGQPARVLAAIVPLAVTAMGWAALRQLSARHRRWLAGLVIVAGAIEAGLALLFLSPTLRPASFRPTSAAISGRERWIGTLGNPGDVAMFLVLPALLAANRSLTTDRRRGLYAILATLMAGVVLASQSLSGVGALVAGTVVLFWRRVPPRRRLPTATAVVVAVTVLVGITPLRGRVAHVADQLREGQWIWLGSGRAAGYAAAAGMLAAHPVTGVGLDLFEANSFRFQPEATLARRARELGLVTAFGEAHNDLLQHAAETGLVGLVLAAAGLWLALRRRPAVPVGLAWPPLLAGAVVIALLQFPLHIPAIAAQWAVLWAMAVPPLSPPTRSTASWRLRQGVAVAAVAAVTWLAWQHHRADVALQQGKLLVETLRTAPPRPARAEMARRAAATLASRRFWLPYSWDLEVTLGNLAMLEESPAAALDHFNAALALAERPEIRFDVGMALLASGDRGAGLDQLERAVRLNPAILQQIRSPEIAGALRGRLDADGYGQRHPWIYDSSGSHTR